MGLRTEQPMTLEEFLAFTDAAPDGVRYEAVEGRPVMMAAPNTRHQHVITGLIVALSAASPPDLRVLTAPLDWVLWERPRLAVRQPDIAVVLASVIGEPRLTDPPLLVAEVLSPTTRGTDQVAKRREYARAGARHYWVLDTDIPSLEALTLTGTDYTTTALAKGAEALTVTEPFPVTVVPADLVS